MKRIQLFEFEDQSWLPDIFRNMITDAIQFDIDKYNIYDPVAPMIKSILKRLNLNRIVDLCSGGSGPLLKFYKQFQKENFKIQITFTDKFPNIETINKIYPFSEDISYVKESIDAADLPPSLKGMRTLFTSFHHFSPAQAKMILQNAVDQQCPIGVFEFTERNYFNLILSPILTPLLMLITTPFIKPRTFSRIFWTYLIPVVPILDTWDGFVSNIRTYNLKELGNLVESVKSHGYKWEMGKVPSPMKPMSITYLIGYPDELDT